MALGQGETTASMRGEVTTADGGPLPGANVVAVHVPSGTRYGTSANQNGRYTLANLRVGGPYRVTVSFVGYQSKREEGVTLDLGQTLRLNFTLEERTAEMEELQVIGKTSGILSSEREGVSTSISTEEIESQPTMGRKIADIARLLPQSYVVNSNDDGAAISIGQQSTNFNSIYIDGAVSNDVYGLSAQGTDGGQSGATPISLSAVEQVSVDVSPFSVTKSGFTGGAINFVTKSGTNDYEGSLEYFRRGTALTQDQLTFRGNKVVDGLPSASDNRIVGTLGGPIIEDELFFFVNVDIRRSEDALPVQTPFLGQELGTDPNQQEQDDPNELDELDEVRDFMMRNTGYDPGFPGSKTSTLDATKFLARLDYNLTDNHKLTARYYYNDNDNRDRFQSDQEFVNFSNNSEVFPNTQHNAMLQWNGAFGSRIATKTTATFKNVVDDRGVQGEPFPSITVTDGARGEFRLGSEAFSYPNYLEQTVATFSNQTDFFVGDHTLTVGTHNEFYSIDNRFAIFGPGSYEFNSVDDFAETVCHYAQQNQGQYGIDQPGPICQNTYPNAEPQTGFYIHQYSLLDDDPSTPEFELPEGDDTSLRSDFNAVKLGFYAQDQWQVTDRFRLTFGLRADIPKILKDPGMAPDANSATLYGTDLASSDFEGPSVSSFYDLKGARAGEMPDWRAFWSPRAGFNYALDEDRTTQIRGGTGVYTSRLPFVWPGGAFLNDGVSSDVAVGLGFAGPIPLRRPANGLTKFDDAGIFGGGAFGATPPSSVDELTPTGNLFIFRDDFSYPRLWRTTLAIDRQLPFGLVGTLEGQYSSQLQDIVTRNVNLKQPNANLEGPTGDDRPIYRAEQYSDESITIDSRYGDIFLMDNTTRGYSYEVTARLQKEATPVWDGGTMRGRVSYTYGDARSLNTYGGDTVGSLWDGNEHVNGTNNLTLGRSEYALGHQVQVSVMYRQEVTENVSTNLSLYYSGSSGRPFSYTIGSVTDPAAEIMIGDEGGSPLFYMPQEVSQFNLQPITDDDDNVLRTVEQQRADLAQFVENVEYLNSNRGEYTERNGDRTPFEGVVDLNFAVNYSGEFLGRTQRLTFTADIYNFSSLLGDVFGTDWGYRYASQGSFSPVEFAGFEDPDDDGNPTPTYQSGLGSREGAIIQDKEDIFNLRTSGTTYSSLYQVQLGVKYTF
ncbi:TonB-dependent receptor [Salinibacter sp. 10B]|uniref:TonB-dependent receptor n=1 Tax=Salinibacter sp. 10B TaxID=1923971 RepID=UPI0021586258|nr:TonB-dependent receptor [Salinibacter sp. 10B]